VTFLQFRISQAGYHSCSWVGNLCGVYTENILTNQLVEGF